MIQKTTSRQQQKDATRQLVFDAAKTLFAAKGFEKTTLREVAKQAGVAPGTIFTHFEDKVALLIEVLREEIEVLVTTTCQTFPCDANIHDQLMHIPKGLFPHYAKHRNLFHPLLKEAFFLDPKRAESLHLQFEGHRQSTEELIKNGKERGEIDPDADTHLASYCFFSHYIFLLIGLMSNPDQTVEQSLTQLSTMVDAMLEGFRPKEPCQ